MKESPISAEDEKLRYDLCQAVSIFPNELDEYLPNSIGRRQIEEIEKITKSYAQKKYQEGELNGRIEENRSWQRILYNRDLSKPSYVTFANLTEREEYLKSQLEKEEQ